MTSAQNILIIDQDLETSNTLSRLLKPEGYEILTSTQGKDASNLVKRHKPALIVLDRVLPDMDGLEIIRRLRNDPDTDSVLILIYSTLASPNDQLKGFEVGTDDYLRKPTTANELTVRIKALLQHAANRQRILSQHPTPAFSKNHSGRLIGILAAKGGTGASLLAMNLGIGLHQAAKDRVVVADFCPGCSTMAAEMGSPGMIGLEKLLIMEPEKISVESVENQLYHHASGVKFLFASPNPGDSQYITCEQQFNRIAQLLPLLSEYAILDLGTRLTPAVRAVINVLQDIILLVEPTPPSLLATRLLIENLNRNLDGRQPLKIVLSYRALEPDALSADQVKVGIKQEISAVLSYSAELILKAQLARTPVIVYRPESKIGCEYRSIAEGLLIPIG